MQRIVNAQIQPQRLANKTLWVRAPGGRKVTLSTAAGPTPEGKEYYRLLGVPPPMLYDYDQPLIHDKWVRDRDGNKVLVRRRGDDEHWIITPKGEDYFKYNRSEYLPSVPYRIARTPAWVVDADGNSQRSFTIVEPLPNMYMSTTDNNGNELTLTVGQIRQARAANGRPLQGAPNGEVHYAEVREATIVILRRKETLLGDDGVRYHILSAESNAFKVWDPQRPIQVNQRRTNFWDDGPPSTETILNRPLRNWALPSGLYRPFDLHPDTFQQYDHGCCVQMLYKSFTKRPSGAQQRRGITDNTPMLTVERVSAELDVSFAELGYAEGVFPFEHGWRHDGVTADMIAHFCKRHSEQGRPLRFAIFHRGLKICEHSPENANRNTPTVCFSIFGDHSFYYSDGKQAIAQKRTASGCGAEKKQYDEFTDRRVREPFPRDDTPPYEQWQGSQKLLDGMDNGFTSWAEESESAPKRRRKNEQGRAGASYFEGDGDLATILEYARVKQDALKGTPRCFEITETLGNDPNVIASLTFSAKDCPKLILKSVPEEAHWLDSIACESKLGMVYRGETVAAFGENLRLAVMRKRHGFAEQMRNEVLVRQGGECAKCGEPLTEYELDHIRPKAEGGEDVASNCQALCPACHMDKTRAERLTSYAGAGYSELNTDVLEALLLAPKLLQLQIGDGTKNCFELDAVKCRRWAVEKADIPLPVACILDSVVPFTGIDSADFVFVDAGPPDLSDYKNFAAYSGPCWYTSELAHWLLETEVKAGSGNAITTDAFIASFRASDHLEPALLRRTYADMEDAMLKSGALQLHEDPQALVKKIILAMQGSWLIQRSFSWNATETNHRDDVRSQIHSLRMMPGHRGVCRYLERRETMTNRTMYLHGLHTLSRERLLVCKGIALTQSIGCTVHGCHVDATLVGGSGAAKSRLDKAAAQTKRSDGSLFFRIKKATQKAPNGGYPPMPKDALAVAPREREVVALASPWRPAGFEVDDVENKWRRFRPSGALGAWLQEPRFLFERHWRTMEEEHGIGDLSASDTFQKEAVDAIFDHGSALCTGPGGAGKSHMIKDLRQRYEAAGFRVDVIAFTHVQAANADGHTVLLDMHRNVLCKKRVIIVDEGGQVPLRLWAVLASLKFTGNRIIVFGDFAGQIGPIADQSRMELWKRVSTSDFMHDLCGGFHVNVRKFRRHKEDNTPEEFQALYQHFSFVTSLYPEPETDETLALHAALEAARARYPVHRARGEYTTTLTLTNNLRVAINEQNNAQEAPFDAIHAPYKGNDTTAQSMRLWPGIVLQAAVTESAGGYDLKNALRYKVLEVTQATVVVTRINDHGKELDGEKHSLATSLVPSKMRLTYAITYDSAQGRTLFGGIRLTQTRHRHMTLRRLIVGLGRAPSGADVEVE